MGRKKLYKVKFSNGMTEDTIEAYTYYARGAGVYDFVVGYFPDGSPEFARYEFVAGKPEVTK